MKSKDLFFEEMQYIKSEIVKDMAFGYTPTNREMQLVKLVDKFLLEQQKINELIKKEG